MNAALVSCIAVLTISGCDCRIFSASMSWERIGATPQFLSRGPSDGGTGCISAFNDDPEKGCTTSSVRTILFTVDAIFSSDAFTTTPVVGNEIRCGNPCFFCTGEPGVACYEAYLEVIEISQNVSLRSNLTLIYTRFQKLNVYTNPTPGNVTAIFRTVHRYPKCTAASSNTRCLGPQNGIINNRDNYCTSCLDDVANQMLNLTSVVNFHDSSGANPWDTRFYQTHRLFPATNHHSPVTTFFPLITLPRLNDNSILFDVAVPAVDEDGAAEPLSCSVVGSTGPCSSNVNFIWGMQNLIGKEGTALNYHSDGTQTPSGGWLLTRRAASDGGGVVITFPGPMAQPTRAGLEVLYPVRIEFEDPLGVKTSLDFLLQICPAIAPVRITSTQLSVSAGGGLPIAPVFLAADGAPHAPPPGRVLCYPGAPCVVALRAAIYDTARGSVLNTSGSCEWGPSARAAPADRTARCADNLRAPRPAERLHIDATHARSRACGGALLAGPDGSRDPQTLASPRCHAVGALALRDGGSVGELNVSVFGGRPRYPQPYEFDIGRKLILCFQARACDTCCYSAPHCVTVEIRGRGPAFTLPAVPESCAVASFQSDRLAQPGLLDPATLPKLADYARSCPPLHACWTLASALADPSPPRPPADGLPAQYSQEPAATRFLFRAEDPDDGETVEVEVLWGPTYAASTLWTVSANLTWVEPATRHGGGCLGRSLADLWARDPLCRAGTREVRVTTGYAPPGAAGASPVQTANVPYLTPPPPPWGGAGEDGHYFVRFDPDRTLCVAASDNQAAKWGRGLNNTQARCHVVRFRGPPAFVGHAVRPDDSPFVRLDGNLMWAGIPTLRAWVGEELRFTMRARDPNPEDAVAVFVLQDPGVPTGLRAGPSTCVPHGTPSAGGALPGNASSPCAEAFRAVAWTPRAGDEGRAYRACFVARDDRGYCAAQPPASVLSRSGPRATARGYYSLTHCVDLDVAAADPAWGAETEAAEGPGAARAVHVGCEFRSPAAAADPHYDMRIDLADADGGGGAVPAGMRLETLSGGNATRVELRWTPAVGVVGG